jgi:CHAD domain-containing protein
MSTYLCKNEPGTVSVRRMARKQTSKALKTLCAKHQPLTDEAVHNARRQLKKVRAYLRLLRPALGSALYHRENGRIRAAARPLTEIRDAKVLVETLDNLLEQHGADLDKAALDGVRRLLLTNQDEVRRKILESDTLRPVRRSLEAARAGVNDWHVGRHGWSVLGRGLRGVYQNGRAAFGVAQLDPTVENLHAWRKQAKYLWHGLEALQPIWPHLLEQLTTEAHTLADFLGDDHDLAILRQKLRDIASQFPDLAVLAPLLEFIDRRKQHLQDQAYDLGHRLYKEKPKDFAVRLEGYWHAWRSEATAAP